MYKFCVQILHFNQNKWILNTIENCYDFVDKIYILWSKYSWLYNKSARSLFIGNSNIEEIKKCKWSDKIQLIEGVWDTEEEQRNLGLSIAKYDNFDYMIIQDADEFYSANDYIEIIKQINDNPNYDYYKVAWNTYWKSLDYVICDVKHKPIVAFPQCAVNLKSSSRFKRLRQLNTENYKILSGLCHHASYVLSDSECWEKINTWGHSVQFNVKQWYENKWKNWNPQTTNLHPITPEDWHIAKYHQNCLPIKIK